MLSPDYLVYVSDDVADIYNDLHTATIEDISRRIVKTLRQTGELQLTETARYQIKRLQASGLSLFEIERRVIEIINTDPNYKLIVERETAALNANLSDNIGKARRRSVIEVRELFKDVSERNYRNEKRVYDQAGIEIPPIDTYASIINANVSRLNTNISNMTGTFATNTDYNFRNIINTAYSKVASGAFSYTAAVSQAVDSLAKEGVKFFAYDSGRADTIEVAVLRAVRTSVAQTAGEITKQMMIDTGTSLVQTSAHINARTHKDGGFKDHTTWQGKVFYWREIDKNNVNNSENPLTNHSENGIMPLGGEIMNTGAFEQVNTLNEEQKIKFFGGKTKAALFDAGLLKREDYFKPLEDIDLSGVMIPDRAAIVHATLGEYTNSTSDDPNGRLHKGGHTIASMNEMDKRGIVYNVVRTSSNGVQFGNVPRHKYKIKQTGENQIWFPKRWTEHDVRTAGIIAANKGIVPPKYTRAKVAEYKSVKTIVFIEDGTIGTIAPYTEQEG